MFRNFLAESVSQAFVGLQKRDLYPDPLKARNARKLGFRSPHAQYDETVLGTQQVRSTPVSTEIRPDDAAGRQYAQMLEDAVHEAGTIRNFGYFDVPDVKLWAEYGVHESPAGNFVEVYCGNALTNPKYELTRRALQVRSAQDHIREGVFLAPAWYHNFYHWMIDLVPRLELVTDFLNQGMPLIAPPRMRSWHRATLQAVLEELDLAEIEIIEPQGGITGFKRLIMPTNITRSLDVSPRQLDILRRSFLKNASSGGASRRLYVSRRDAANRQIKNENEVCAQLLRRGFEVITMSQLTPVEQATLFSNAEVVIGAHGAAFANLAFCQEGAQVIEVFREGHFAPCFARIAQSAQLGYGFGVGQQVGANTYFDPEQLNQLLDIAGL